MIRSELHYFMSGKDYIRVEQPDNMSVNDMINRWKDECIDSIEYRAKKDIIQYYSITKKTGRSTIGERHIELNFYISYKYGYDMIELEIFYD